MNNNLKSNMTTSGLLIASMFIVLLTVTGLLIRPSEGVVNGKVVYMDKTEVQDAVINVLAKNDLSLVSSQLTDDKGTFSIKGLAPGEYYISVQMEAQKQKVYGPVFVAKGKQKVVIKPIIIPVQANAAQAVVTASVITAAS